MSNEAKSCDTDCELGPVFAMLLLRLWLGVRAFQTGVEKFAGFKEEGEPTIIDGKPSDVGLVTVTDINEYGFDHYHDVPTSQLKTFKGEPLIPEFALTAFDYTLGPILIILGITTLLGIATRTSLLAMGLLYTGLTFGMILMGGPAAAAGISWLGTHIILIVGALLLLKYNKFALYKKW